MIAIIDTSSLMALVRYYLPFDKNDSIKNIIREKFEKGELIVLDKVADEAKFLSKSIIINQLEFISTKSPSYTHVVKTDNLLPSGKFLNRLDNEFCNKDVLRKQKITPEEYEVLKQIYLNNADAKIILYAQDYPYKGIIESLNGLVVVTEETTINNDGKVFKKIPTICNLMGLNCCTLPEFLKTHLNINLSEVCH